MLLKRNPALVKQAKAMRKAPTPEERRLWYDFLRTHTPKFTRQKVLGRYIADFYCAEAKLVVELDGSGHDTEEALRHDAERTEFLAGYGIRVLRISNTEVRRDFNAVCAYIIGAVVRGDNGD
ncbi:MAG: endonuclease domain-containing protein [Clostridia bacterium]|nr:endonuclease domain-containing protein [Clostridia bacterium]